MSFMAAATEAPAPFCSIIGSWLGANFAYRVSSESTRGSLAAAAQVISLNRLRDGARKRTPAADNWAISRRPSAGEKNRTLTTFGGLASPKKWPAAPRCVFELTSSLPVAA